MAYVLLENRKTLRDQMDSHYFYGAYTRICCNKFENLNDCFNQVDKARRAGKYLVGYLAYEAAYGLNEAILPSYQYTAHFPLLDFYCFDHHDLLSQKEVDCLLEKLLAEQSITNQETFIYNAKFNMSFEQYKLNLEKIKQYLEDGETYQVNFTGKYQFRLNGSVVHLYHQLREMQKVEFSSLFFGEDFQLVSLSPELFFEKKGESFRSRPMKGTMPRSHDLQQDLSNKEYLRTNPKIIAENMIVVDLIRNDLSMIAQAKSVITPNLFEIETYETVYQMTSTISCRIDKELSFGRIVSSIFPCGSITGAPKIRTMQIIRELEQQDRGIYTGAIGFISPDNDMCFNVAIRTLHLENNKGEMGVGGGIIFDSTIREEFEEVHNKAKFFMDLPAPFNLIECFFYDSKAGFRYLSDHLNRMGCSAKFFNFQFPKQIISNELTVLATTLETAYQYKIKIILQKNGMYSITSVKLQNQSSHNKILIYDVPISESILLYHKTDATSVRGYYDRILMQESQKHPLFDVIFVNKNGYITEGSKSNIFISKGTDFLTPALSCGLLPGVMRKKFMEKYPQTREAYLTKDDIMEADIIWLTNSVIGTMNVSLI